MSIFPTTMLLATDGSEEAKLAARTAVELADRTNSELHVVHVGRPEPIGSYEIHYEEVTEALRRQAQGTLDEQVREIEAAGGTVAEAHLEMAGRREEAIVRLSEELGAGLIVMGSRGLGGIRRALMGSVSDSVVRHAHCPVLVVRPEKGTGDRPRSWRRRPLADRPQSPG
ncbi:MAG: universal stress protein [Actinomycetota bacterium]|nr:universal stress protein [Actinomycetota bacterium]